MPQDNAALWLAEEWARQFTRSVESMTGEPVLIQFAPRELAAAEIDPAQQHVLWWDQPLSLSPDARVWIGCSAATWQEIGNRVLHSAGVDDATPEDIRSTYLEIVNQALSGVASAVSTRARKEISCVEGRSAAPPAAPDAGVFGFEITLGGEPFPLLAIFAPAVANLSDAPPPAPAKAAPAERAQ